MAPAQGSSARSQRLTALVAIVSVAASIAVTFGRVYEGRATTLRLLAFATASGLTAWLLERRSLFIATLVSAVLLVTGLGLLVFPETTWHGLPTLSTLREMASAAAEVGHEARARTSPTAPVEPLVFAGAMAVWAAVFSCHSLAFRAGSPLLSLVPPAALVAFSDSVLDPVRQPLLGLLFLVGALAIVFADSLRRVQGWGPVWSGPGGKTRLLPTTGRGGRRIAAASIVAAALAPSIVPGFGSKAVIDLSSSGGDDLIRVSPLVSVASRLTSDQPREVFIVRSEQRSYWRMTALEAFDGVSWRLPEEETRRVVSGAPLGGSLGPGTVRATFTASSDLGFPWLPTPYRPSAVTIDAEATWADRSQTLTVERPLREGDTYTVTATFARPSVEDLRAEVFPDLSVYPELYPDLVALPPDLPAQIRGLAVEWTAGAATTYDQIMAIQQHLTDPDEFAYSTEVDLRDDSETLLRFLTVGKKGFCQQFASAMAVMLRALGIPARVAVGFTPGASFGDGDSYRVMTDDLHAWVEVLFPSYGWLAFEPTPGRANPAAQTYIRRPGDGDGSGQTNCPRRAPRSPACQGDGSTATPTSPPPGIDPGRGLEGSSDEALAGTPLIRRPAFIGGAIALSAALVLVGIPLAGAARRRRILRRAGADPRRRILASYRVFLDGAAGLGLARRPGETPGEYGERVRRSGRLRNGHLDRLTGLAVRAAYAPAAPTGEDALDAEADAKETLEELRRSASLLTRVAGAYARR